MATAKPESAHDEFLKCFRAGDLDGMLALYEDDAVFVNADGSVRTGKPAIREALGELLAAGGTLNLKTRYAVRTGDIALLSNAWSLTGKTADGEPLDMSGQTTEVVRLQTDGRWLYIVDHPWGGM